MNGKEPYPLLQFRDIVYFPLTWRFAVDEFGWNYTFDKSSGLNISADNFFYLGEAKAYYFKDDLKIQMVTEHARTGIVPGNLCIIKNGSEKWIGSSTDYFGYYYTKGPIFTIKDNFIHTTHLSNYDDKSPRPCRIRIETGEIIIE